MPPDGLSRENDVYLFGPFRLEARERRLSRNGEPVHLSPKVFDVLLYLAERPGRLASKEELLSAVWAGTFVEEGTVNRTVSSLRKVLGETLDQPVYIQTIPTKGYRFVASISNPEVPVPPAGPAEGVPPGSVPGAPSRTRTPASLLSGRGRPVLALAAVVISVALLLWNVARGQQASPRIRSVAVLPFRLLSGASHADALRLGLADAIITRLSATGQIAVRPTASVLFYATNPRDPVEAGRELGVEAVLDGKIQGVGDRLRVTLHLVRVADGSSLWADKFDDASIDVFQLQDDLSARAAAALSIRLSGEAAATARKRFTHDLKAYELYQEGRYLWNHRLMEEGIHDSIANRMKRALEIDPDFALAYVGVADAYAFAGNDEGHWREGEAAARRALGIDDTMGEAHASLGFYQLFHRWDPEEADRELKLAVTLSPNYATAHQWRATLFAIRGRIPEALSEIQEAAVIDPLSPAISADLAQMLYFSRDYRGALARTRQILSREPGFAPALAVASDSQRLLGMVPDSEAWGPAALLHRESPWGGTWEARLPFRTSEETTAFRRAILAVEPGDRAETAFQLARVLAWVGDRDEALRRLEAAVAGHAFLAPFCGADPMFDALRDDPRFSAILRRLGLRT